MLRVAPFNCSVASASTPHAAEACCTPRLKQRAVAAARWHPSHACTLKPWTSFSTPKPDPLSLSSSLHYSHYLPLTNSLPLSTHLSPPPLPASLLRAAVSSPPPSDLPFPFPRIPTTPSPNPSSPPARPPPPSEQQPPLPSSSAAHSRLSSPPSFWSRPQSRSSSSSQGPISGRSSRQHRSDSELSASRPLPLPLATSSASPLSREEVEELMRCDPELKDCKDVVFQWTDECSRCQGSGFVSFKRKRGRDVTGTCIACHGIGAVHRFTVRDNISVMKDIDSTS